MSSRRTSSRAKTITPGRSVTTLNNPGTKSVRKENGSTSRKNGKNAAVKSMKEESEPEDSDLSEEDAVDEDAYEEPDDDEVDEEEATESEEVDSDDIDQPSSKRGVSKRKQPPRGKGNGASASAAKKQKTSGKGKAVVEPKTTAAVTKNGKPKPKAGDNYPAPGQPDTEDDEEVVEEDYSSYSDGEGNGDSDDSIELEEGQEIKGYAQLLRTTPHHMLIRHFSADAYSPPQRQVMVSLLAPSSPENAVTDPQSSPLSPSRANQPQYLQVPRQPARSRKE